MNFKYLFLKHCKKNKFKVNQNQIIVIKKLKISGKSITEIFEFIQFIFNKSILIP